MHSLSSIVGPRFGRLTAAQLGRMLLSRGCVSRVRSISFGLFGIHLCCEARRRCCFLPADPVRSQTDRQRIQPSKTDRGVEKLNFILFLLLLPYRAPLSLGT